MARKGFILYKGMEISLTQILSRIEQQIFNEKVKRGEEVKPAEFLSKVEEKVIVDKGKKLRKRRIQRVKRRKERRKCHQEKMAQKISSPGRRQGKVKKRKFRKN